jgi:hypothetical protein
LPGCVSDIDLPVARLIAFDAEHRQSPDMLARA